MNIEHRTGRKNKQLSDLKDELHEDSLRIIKNENKLWGKATSLLEVQH